MNKLRLDAEKLRDQGYSYGMIHEELGVAKSTMSYWFRDKPFKPNHEVVNRIKYGPIKSGAQRHNKRVENIRELKKLGIEELGVLSKRDLWMLGIGLYIGEGSKTTESIRISNSDPATIVTAIKWFKEVCGLSSENIVITLHLYLENNIQMALDYWQNTTKLPYTSFRKTHIDTRDNKKAFKHGKLPYGTAHLRVISNGDFTKGVVLYRRIAGWMAGSLNQL